MKLNHKWVKVKGQGDKVITISHNPSINVIVQNATDDKGDLIISDDFLVDEVISATMFKLTHDGG